MSEQTVVTTSGQQRVRRAAWGALLAVIVLIYLSSLQTIPNGSSDPYMIDVGETQIALNIWGTLHATGYPLYTILGNLFTPLPRLWGANPAAAVALFSALWTVLALSLFGALLRRWGVPLPLALAGVLLLALTRSIWVHSVVAEVYSLSLALLMGMWWVVYGLAQRPLRHRLLLLGLLGGLGVFHHRTLILLAPGLLLALWPDLRAAGWKRSLNWLFQAGLVGLLGFLPYLYLPLRANAQAAWVYGEVGTWDGFWFQFWGREADHLVTAPTSAAAWQANLSGTLGTPAARVHPAGGAG
ncbi:MAG: DUF2723 domain-containing protein, partial [Anaerolineae bacterium]|nr:DUF2723 domain-containing protein [Anaerolineae bacterium]